MDGSGLLLLGILLGVIVIGILTIIEAEALSRRHARRILNALRPKTDEEEPIAPTG